MPLVSATITIIATEVESPSQFESMYIDERRSVSSGWKSFPARSGRYPDGIVLQATNSDLGVFECDPDEDIDTGEKLHTFLIDRKTLVKVLPKLKAIVETNAATTARALVENVGGAAELERVSDALKNGTWPEVDDAAAEAAAFAHHLLGYARIAVASGKGVCWEYRGEFPLADQKLGGS